MKDFCSLFQNNFLILGLGSPLRQDDQAGLIACDELARYGITCIKCEYGLENCIGEIENYHPHRLVIIDAALFKNGKPGDVIVVASDSIEDYGLVISTHSIPQTLILDMLKKTIGVEEVFIIGIYPKTLDLGLEISFEVLSAVKSIAEKIIECLNRERKMEEEV